MINGGFNRQGFLMKQQWKPRFVTPKNIYLHLLRNSLIGFLLIAGSLFAGMAGYHLFEGMSWVDSFLNASMILSGMGPADKLVTNGGKLFAGFYALFSGLAFIAIVVVMFSPIIHKLFRKIHMEVGKEND